MILLLISGVLVAPSLRCLMENLLGVILKGLLQCLRFCIKTHRFLKIYPMRDKIFCNAASRGMQRRGQLQSSCWTIHLSGIQATTANMVPYAFAGIKVNDNGYGFRDKTSSRSDPGGKTKNTIGETNNVRPFESSAFRLTPLTMQDVTPNFPPQPLGLASNPSSFAILTNPMHFPIANPQPSPLPRPNGRGSVLNI